MPTKATGQKTEVPEAAKAAPKKAKPATTPARASAKKVSKKTGDTEVYTKPELREKLKEKVKAGEKGGQAGQWSARKAQLLAAEYKKEGGGYKKGAANEGQKHLKSWTEEQWQTEDGKKAARGKTTARYLPKEAWEKLSPAERKATDAKKRTTSRTGEQFAPNTAAAKKARKSAAKS